MMQYDRENFFPQAGLIYHTQAKAEKILNKT